MKTCIILLLALFILGCSENRKKVVLIQPYGDIDQELVLEVQKSIEETYGFDVYIADAIDLPRSAFINVKSPRYRADSILSIQKLNKPDSIDFVIGLTNRDISTTKRDASGKVLQPASRYADWGVFGLGLSPGCSALISTFRLGTGNEKRLVKRLRNVCNHELGHNLGLPHCTNSAFCVMIDAAESIKTVGNAPDTLCEKCKAKI